MKTALVCIAKDEDNYIDEWIKYNLKLGFTDIYICNNDWEFSYQHPNVYLLPISGKQIQWQAYNTSYNKLKNNYDWIAFFDVDEFLVLKRHKNISEFLTNYKDYPAVGINWVFFGDNNLSDKDIKDYSVLKRFTKRQIGVNNHIKSIVNTSYPHNFIGIHNPVSQIVDTDNNIFEGAFNISGGDEIAQLNHYWCKTKEEFSHKIRKGRADIDEYRDISEFNNHNYNEIEDKTALNFFNNTKNFAFIIDAYPSTDDEESMLLSNIKKIKSEGIDILLTSHNTCNSEIIESVDYFLFEKSNNYYYLDSDILNNDLSNLKEPIFMKYYTAGETFIDRVVITGWSVAIASQFFNAIKFLKSKGYDYAFYLISDFVYPNSGFSRILNSVDFDKNYLIKNSDNFSSWFAPFFFGFKIDNDLLSKIPNEDLSSLEVYQKYFTNCSFEDVIKNTFSGLQNDVHEFQKLDDIFGPGNWNTNKSTIQKGPASLHYCTSSSVYVNLQSDNKFCLFLYLSPEYELESESVTFEIIISNKLNQILYKIRRSLLPGWWYKEEIKINENIIFYKKVSDGNIEFEDTFSIKLENLEKYSILKKYE